MSARRIAAIVLSSLRLTLARQREPALEGVPFAVVVARSDGKLPHGERSILGNTRLDEISPRARKDGVRPGDTVAQARAKRAELAVRVVRESDARGALESLAEALLAFGATTAILEGRDTIALDVTGCAHLHEGGEPELAQRVAERVAALGYDARVAVTDGPERAWAIARFAREKSVIVVAPGDERAATSVLPVDALRLDERTTTFFRRIGVGTLGELVKLPRRSLASRLDKDARRVFLLLDGEDATPLARFEPHEELRERVDLEYGAESIPPILFVLKSLTTRVAARLDARARSAAKLRIELGLDAAMLPPNRKGPPVTAIELPLPLPLHREGELFAGLRARLERDVKLEAPVLSVTFLVPELVVRNPKERFLFEAEARSETTLGPLLAELGAIVGEGAVGKLHPIARWRGDARSKLVPFSTKPLVRKKSERKSLEPIRQLPEPEPCPDAVPRAHVLRTESVEWWRADAPPASDRLLASIEGALAIVEIDAYGITLKGFLD